MVPILLSITTLRKLGAVIDFHCRTIIFKHVDPGITIPLTESRSGHLLLDLTRDWFQQPRATSDLSPKPRVLSQIVTSPRYKECCTAHECGVGTEQEPPGLLHEGLAVKSADDLVASGAVTCPEDAQRCASL